MDPRGKNATPAMQVLYFSSPVEDYLSDSLLHGLRTLLGAGLVDVPERGILYRSHQTDWRRKMYGGGFTLYNGLLEDIAVDRSDVLGRLQAGAFDLVVFGSIWTQYEQFARMRPWLDPIRTVILDGADSPQVYPFAGRWLRTARGWVRPRADQFLYFKREWTPDSQFNLWHRLVPPVRRKHLAPAPNLRRIAFSIPEEKVTRERPTKQKDFPRHIVDADLLGHIGESQSKYAFAREEDYYADLRSSRFGVTTKRSGWDCMRHYEIAANGAVPCFRALDAKPETCAPHGLDRTNCLVYNDASDLTRQIASLSESQYDELQRNAMQWALANTTRARAIQFLASLPIA
jgi:hypothetical protein